MNMMGSQPAIFNGPEMTSPKDVLYNSGWENRDLHNINGIIFVSALDLTAFAMRSANAAV